MLELLVLFFLLLIYKPVLFISNFLFCLYNYPIASRFLFAMLKKSQYHYKMFVSILYYQLLSINISILLQLKFFFVSSVLKKMLKFTPLLVFALLPFLLSSLLIFTIPLFLSSKSLFLMRFMLRKIALS